MVGRGETPQQIPLVAEAAAAAAATAPASSGNETTPFLSVSAASNCAFSVTRSRSKRVLLDPPRRFCPGNVERLHTADICKVDP